MGHGSCRETRVHSLTPNYLPNFSLALSMQSGQTIILSGLVNKELQSDVSKLAGLGDLPVLGALFRSNNYRNGRTDLVIFVTPTVIDPVSGINQERLQKAQEIENIFATPIAT
jgi:pilus assembly protein CpaC